LTAEMAKRQFDFSANRHYREPGMTKGKAGDDYCALRAHVVGVIAFRLQKRTKPPSKSGPRPEPSITDTKEWPPVTTI
ncbi:MAG TPA: hypothetical protein VJY33_19065, partial [Isosphaeraceae bacterium]|nr:hypothetical protein [Isosphaeraceae bacterium]